MWMITASEVKSWSQMKSLITRIVFNALRGVKRARIVTRFRAVAVMGVLRASRTMELARRSRLSQDHPTRLSKRVIDNVPGHQLKENKPSTKWLVLKSFLRAILLTALSRSCSRTSAFWSLVLLKPNKAEYLRIKWYSRTVNRYASWWKTTGTVFRFTIFVRSETK